MALIPAGHRILVKPESVFTTDDVYKAAMEAGIEIPMDDMTRRREEAGQTIGILAAIGMNAWKGFDGGKAWSEVGDKVLYSKHGGEFVQDPETDEVFVVMNDNDVLCIVTKGEKND